MDKILNLEKKGGGKELICTPNKSRFSERKWREYTYILKFHDSNLQVGRKTLDSSFGANDSNGETMETEREGKDRYKDRRVR